MWRSLFGAHLLIFDDRLNELRVQKARCLQERSRERRGIEEVGGICHSLQSTTTAAPDTLITEPVEARAPPSSPGASTSFSRKREDAGNANPPETQEFKPKQSTGRIDPGPPGQGIQLDSPPIKDDQNNKGAGSEAGAGAGSDDRSLPGSPPSPSRTGAADTGGGGGEIDKPKATQGDGCGALRETGSGDEILEYFLARHAKEAVPPLGGGAGRQGPRCSALSEERGLENGAEDSERDTRVLW